MLIMGSGDEEIIWSERESLLMRSRYDRAIRALGIIQSLYAIMSVLYLEGGMWSVTALSDFTNVPRRTASNDLKRNLKWGLAGKKNGLYFITPQGSEILANVHTETMKIIRGEQVGYSVRMLRYFNVAGRSGRIKNAVSIRFL